MQAAGITVLLGAVMREVTRDGRRIRSIELATRFGDVRVRRPASSMRPATRRSPGTRGLPAARRRTDRSTARRSRSSRASTKRTSRTRPEITARLKAQGEGLWPDARERHRVRFPGRNTAMVNMTHVETPLDPLECSNKSSKGKVAGGSRVAFLRGEFPAGFGKARGAQLWRGSASARRAGSPGASN